MNPILIPPIERYIQMNNNTPEGYDDFAMDALIIWDYILDCPWPTPFREGIQEFRKQNGVYATRQWVIDASVQIQLGFQDAFEVSKEHVAELGIAYVYEWLPSLLEDAYKHFLHNTCEGMESWSDYDYLRSYTKDHYLETLKMMRAEVTINKIREEQNDG
jgi:hypothetical protein